MLLQNYELPPGKQYFGRELNPFQKSLQNGKNLKLEKVFKMGMVLGYYASTDRQTFVPKRAFKTWIILVYTRFSGHFFSTGLTVLVTQKILISCRLIRVRRTEPNLNRKCLLGKRRLPSSTKLLVEYNPISFKWFSKFQYTHHYNSSGILSN